MASVLSLYAGNAMLTAKLSGLLYVALHESDPTDAGLLATEVAGGGYVRQSITFGAASNKTKVSSRAQIFAGMPACTVTYLAVWDAISDGHMIFSKLLTPAITVLASGQFLIAKGDIAMSL